MIITDQQKLDCIKREMNIRRFAYPRWVRSGRYSQTQANTELAIMSAIQGDYQDRIELAERNSTFARRGSE